MASIRKYQNGWRVFVYKKGVRKSRTFKSKSQAQDWAREIESEIISQHTGKIHNKPLADLFNRYVREVSQKKRGYRWESIRINAFLKDPIASINTKDLSSTELAQWRDRRLKRVSPATVNREWNLLSNIFNTAVKEWKWLDNNPLSDVARPKSPPPRTRRITDEEIERILYCAGYDHVKISTRDHHIAAAFLFAIETAMRASEICSLHAEDVNYQQQVAHLSQTKNGFPRDVPLSKQAIKILKTLPDQKRLFDLTPQRLDSNWRKLRDRAAIEDLHFHDTRAEACTRLADKVDVLTLARITGHRDLKMLMIYYRESVEDIAKKLG